jgi:SNF2 family DNA or RNA helicase
MDTLKQGVEYRNYLEKAHWDIIIIDEAHNVAERSGSSQRARLARLLSTRSDTLIMLSATPHDGRAKSFASLLNMLDATAIANPEKYSTEDYADKGLVIRRFALENMLPRLCYVALQTPPMPMRLLKMVEVYG